ELLSQSVLIASGTADSHVPAVEGRLRLSYNRYLRNSGHHATTASLPSSPRRSNSTTYRSQGDRARHHVIPCCPRMLSAQGEGGAGSVLVDLPVREGKSSRRYSAEEKAGIIGLYEVSG